MRIRGFVILALFAALALPSSAHAQGSRKDDIVLNRFGQPVAGATVRVCTSGATGTPCFPLASIYSDVALTQPLANPLTSDGQGNYHFYAAPGRYMIQLSGAGVTTTTIPDVLLPADPTSPSFQTLSVAQNISALNLNLSGNLTVSGGVSSPSTLSAPQQGSAAPVQIGPHWYAGTASGQCTAPGAPAVVVETVSSGTGSIGTASYQYRVALYNRNGTTNMGPATTYAAPSGTTNRILVQLGNGDYSYRSGCYGFRVYVSSDGGNTWWRQNAWTLPAAGISSWTRNAAGLVTITTSAAHGFIPGESVTISGASAGSNSTNINGTFTLIGQQASTPTTLFLFQSASLGADSGGPGGTGTVIAGLGADPAGHFAPGDFIISTILTSGTQGPTTNTATIDPIQVALNATCNYATNSCAAGGYDVSQGATALTTPLIVSNQQTVEGVNAPLAVGKSTISCSWKDPNLGCVMLQGIANGVNVHGLDIESAGHGLMSLGWGPGFANSHQFVRYNNISTSDLTGQYSAIYFHGNTLYDSDYSGNFLQGGLAAVQMDAVSGEGLIFGGGATRVRWNVANLSGAGLSTNALLSVSSVTDPDRAQNRVAFPSGEAFVKISNLTTESATGVQFDATNMGVMINNVITADPNALSGTPAIVRIGTDANAGAANFGFGAVIEDTYFQPGANAGAMIQLIGATSTFPSLVLRNVQGGQTNAIDFNNVSLCVYAENSLVRPYASATGDKIINVPVSGCQPQFFGLPFAGSSSQETLNQFSGSLKFIRPNNNADGLYFSPGGSQDWRWYSSDPITATYYFQRIGYSTGGYHQWLDVSGNLLFAVTGNASQDIVSHYGSGFRFNSNQAGSSYFTFGGTPSAARTITWPDASGTVAYVLSGTSGSLGGSALTAGTCSSTTVTISGATTSMTATASPSSDPGSGYYWLAFVSSSNTVTVRICAAASGTPTSTTYNVRVIQ